MITKDFDIKVNVDKTAKFQNVYSALEDAINAAIKIKDYLETKYNKRVKFNLELMLENAVRAFYDSYSPNSYDRQEDLLNAAKITVEPDEPWSIETGAEYMHGGHRAGNDYIYVNSFEQGYHGGAVDGPEHPSPGTPWWRIPGGPWISPATQGPSPEEELAAQDPIGYIEKQEKEYDDEAVRRFTPYFNKAMTALQEFYGR